MDNLILETEKQIKNKRNLSLNNKKNTHISKYINNLFTRTLLSVILVLICAIFIEYSDNNLLFFKNKLFNDTFSFTKINELYTKYFGNIIADNTLATPVFNDNTLYSNITELDNSYKVELNTNTMSFLESGIVVFIGEKDNLGKTVIVQGIDGVDIWYSNISSCNLTIYDYIKKDDILGEVNDNEVILTFMEDGNYINYEKYLN
jgi:stage IV sporulation protein FA